MRGGSALYSVCKKLKYSAAILALSLLFIITLYFFSVSAVSVSTFSPRFNTLNVILDPGHGGEDGGAVSPSGIKESEINLDIAGRTRLIMGLYGVPTSMTRESENIYYPPEAETTHARKVFDQRSRLELINGTQNAVLISIHQNYFSSPKAFGAEALYSPTEGSEDFGKNMQDALVSALDNNNRRKAAKIPENIFLMNHISCPAVLVECGFLSNPTEEALLKTDAYKLKIAAVITSGYLTSEKILKETCYGGENEIKNDILLY